MQKKKIIVNLKIKKCMTKKPYLVKKNKLQTDILYLMKKKKLQIFVFIAKKIEKKLSE